MPEPAADGVRRVEIVGALSLAADLGMGQPLEQGLRGCLVAQRLARVVGLDAAGAAATAALALLRFIGCTADSHTGAVFFDDEIEARTVTTPLIYARPREAMGAMVGIIRGDSVLRRTATSLALAATGVQRFRAGARAHCEVAELLAGRLGFEDDARRGLDHVFERWDGQGFPHRARGEEIELTARIVHVAYDAAAEHRATGRAGVIAMARERSGRGYDPRLVDALCADLETCLGDLDVPSVWEAVLASAGDWNWDGDLCGHALDDALEVMADFADLKSSYTPGHSRAVARRAGRAAAGLGLPAEDVVTAQRAGLVHDLGRAGVSVHVWDKPGPLTLDEQERARLHAYYTERVLAPVKSLTAVARIASLHHERLDGSGYHRGTTSAGLPSGARVLAAADAYQAMTEARAHRPALPAVGARAALRAEARAGRLDADAVSAVLEERGSGRRDPDRSPGLSAREVEVLRLLARGCTTRQIARALGITVKTADSHVQHIYTKAGVSTRAAATLYAIQRGLLPAL
ncbi:HD domain-containing phosphohydrolase [Blastococcus deserti]|uniref:HD domain-containing phosphohydrolase n=1 Tax=Blastococcus deserti TaxID=2259033 RepID=A0ABW4X6D3_9ACTN